MRKFTILLSLVVLASMAVAQLSQLPKQNFLTSKSKISKVEHNATKDAVWSVTFEEETPVWTTSETEDMPAWTISDQDGAPANWATETGFYFEYLGEYSPTGNEVGGKWAWLDIVGSQLPGGSGDEQPILGEAYIQFDNIDLSAVTHPKLSWYQLNRAFNPFWYDNFIEVSIDGGTTWTSHTVNDDFPTYDYGPIFMEIIIMEAAEQSDVSIRFRWEQDRLSGQPSAALVGYGWQIDDITIVENYAYDMELKDVRMNFFSTNYVDYNDPLYTDYFHLSSFYGNIPVNQYESANAISWFNFIVKNKGYEASTPIVNVTVSDPLGDEIYNFSVTGMELATDQIDTIDVLESEFNIPTPLVGKYSMSYTVTIDGHDDEANTDNEGSDSIFLTNGFYARDYNQVTNRFGLSNFTAYGEDGEMIGTDYTFVVMDTIQSVELFIDEGTDAGVSFVLHALFYDGENYVTIASSSLINVEEADLDTWMNVEFTDLAVIIPDAETGYIDVRIAVETFYNGLENFYIGIDKTASCGLFGSFMYIPGDDTWYYGMIDGGVPAYHLLTPKYDPNNVEQNNINANLSIYPNPTTGMLNIEGIEGADVQIINMMGQVVESVENLNEYNQIDMSKYANGTYFVKAIVDGNVVTRKINLMK